VVATRDGVGLLDHRVSRALDVISEIDASAGQPRKRADTFCNRRWANDRPDGLLDPNPPVEGGL
jgi:hypothetical protein